MRFGSGLLALLLPLMVVAPLCAAEGIEVRSFDVNVRSGVFELNMRASFPADEKVREALAAGATINLRLQAVVDQKYRYWFDERLADVALRRELSWNALSQRYVLCYEVQSAECSRQQTFTTLEEALVVAGTVENWAVVVEQQLDPDAACEISVRASMRNGRIPKVLRALTFWTTYWNNRSAWKSWVLPR